MPGSDGAPRTGGLLMARLYMLITFAAVLAMLTAEAARAAPAPWNAAKDRWLSVSAAS